MCIPNNPINHINANRKWQIEVIAKDGRKTNEAFPCEWHSIQRSKKCNLFVKHTYTHTQNNTTMFPVKGWNIFLKNQAIFS